MKPDLVLLHGWAINSKIWDATLPKLKQSFTVHLLDLPGYGRDHAYVGDYSLNSVVERVVNRAPENANWIAWSLGATIAMAAALKFPGRVARLQLISPTPRFMAAEDWECGMDPQSLASLSARFELGFERGLKKFLLLQFGDAAMSKSLANNLAKAILSYNPPSEQILKQSLSLLKETDLRSQFTALANGVSKYKSFVPTQIVSGERDRVISSAASKWLAKTIPGTECKMLDCGHLPFIESPIAFLELTEQFFLRNVST